MPVQSIESHLFGLAEGVIDGAGIDESLVFFHVEQKAACLADHCIRSTQILHLPQGRHIVVRTFNAAAFKLQQ